MALYLFRKDTTQHFAKIPSLELSNAFAGAFKDKLPHTNDKNPVLPEWRQYGFYVNMGIFVSLQKLLFAHNPLDASDKGVQVLSKFYQQAFWNPANSHYCCFFRPFQFIATRSWKISLKQICLWDLARIMYITFIIQIVEAIWFFAATVLHKDIGTYWFWGFFLNVSGSIWFSSCLEKNCDSFSFNAFWAIV